MNLEITDAPNWLGTMLTEHKISPESNNGRKILSTDNEADIEWVTRWLQNEAPLSFQGEGGDNTAFIVASRAREKGLSQVTNLDLLLTYWNPRCEPPWSPEELEVKVRNAYKYAKQAQGADSLPEEFTAPVNSPRKVPNVEEQSHGEKKNSPFPILTFKELQEKEIPVRAKLLPWLSEGGLAMVYAPAGCGKTHFAQSLAIALCDGSSFLKWTVTKAVSVLYVDGEMAQGDFRDRWKKWVKKPGENELFTLSHEDFFEREEKDLNLGEEQQRDKLKATIEQHPEIRVVILDNLSCLFPTLREDKRDDWVREVLPLLIWLRRRGVAVILLHHTGKGGDQRGTVARLDALNTSIKLKPLESEDGKKSAFEIHFTKARDCFGEDKNPLSCRLNEDFEGFFIWVWQSLEESSEDRLLNLIEDSGGEMSVKEAADAMDVTPGRISHLKAALIKSGKLVKNRVLKLAKVDSKVDSGKVYGSGKQ